MSRWQVARSRSRSWRRSARGYARTFTLTDGNRVVRATVELLTGGSIFEARRPRVAQSVLLPYLNRETPPRRVVVGQDGTRRVVEYD